MCWGTVGWHMKIRFVPCRTHSLHMLGLKEIYCSRKQQWHQCVKKALKNLFRKMVKVSSSSTVLCVYWPGWRQDGQLCCSLQLLLPISYCDSSHRQINIPRSYMYQHFHPYHVLEHLRHAETWWCKYRKAVSIYMHLLILEEYFT